MILRQGEKLVLAGQVHREAGIGKRSLEGNYSTVRQSIINRVSDKHCIVRRKGMVHSDLPVVIPRRRREGIGELVLGQIGVWI
jgi:hypothetical protein